MLGFFNPGRTIKHLLRYRQVVAILTRYGFGEVFSQIRVWKFFRIENKMRHRQPELAHIPTAQRLRMALEELGPTFVKLGQMLSTRPDLLPPEYIHEFEKLQNRVSPVPARLIKNVIESELKKPLDQIFDWFDETPLAAASLAQVHRASLAGRQVAVKVQRPAVAGIIQADLDILSTIAALMERYLKGAYVINPTGIIREFTDNVHNELNFMTEARNMRVFAANFKGTAWLHVPEVYLEDCCTRKVLIMEYVDGIPLSDIARLQKEGYDLKALATHGADIAFRSALEFGFFHADPHPGNVLVLPGNVICLLDFGMMGTLSSRTREKLGQLMYFIAENDERRTARALLGLIESNEVIDAETLEGDVSDIIHEFGHSVGRQLSMGNIFFKLIKLLGRHHARFPTHLVWLFKSIGTLEDSSLKMNPDFELVKAVNPYARKLVFHSFNPFKQTREAYFSIFDSLNFFRDLPYDAGVVLEKLKKGRIKIEFEHVGLEPLRKTLHRITHHLVLTILLAALLISSSLIVLAEVPPMIGHIPVIGIAGFGLSLIVAVILIITIIIE
ncbi:MAG TPA: AarF/ABC1/UbiB kinase family protein [Dehalococcoidales bacterium]|nr:AarF/ABC1/UbiB kinase family protein [Dehalococcoidales bacterium]